MFNPVVSYVPGKSHHVADALSRHPKFHFMSEGEDCIAGVYEQRCCHASSHWYARDDPKMAPLFAAARNANYRKVVEAVRLEGSMLICLLIILVGNLKKYGMKLPSLTSKWTHSWWLMTGKWLSHFPHRRRS